MKNSYRGLFAALCGFLLFSGQVSAAPLDELEALAASSPGDYGKIFDNASSAGGDVSSRAMSQQQLKQMMLADLDSLKNIFAARYAPADWKGRVNGWDLDAEIQKAKDAVNASGTVTVKEYQKIVQRLFASPQDYHVSATFYSTELALLPISITESGGKYYLSSINRKALPEDVFPFRVGDEVTAFGGKDINTAIAEYMAENGMNNVPGADRAIAASRLRVRAGVLANDVPQGPVALEIKPAGAAAAVPFQVNWSYTPELIPPQQFVSKSRQNRLPLDWMGTMYADLMPYSGAAAAGFGMGDKDGFLPDLGEKVWQAPAASLFRAYVYRNPAGGRNTGYVRIPTYMVSNPEALVRDFAKIISEFDRSADALVIDQLNNPGGIVMYMQALASMLTDTPLELPKHRITLTPADVLDSVNFIQDTMAVKTEEDAKKFMGETAAGYPMSLGFLNNYREFAKSVIKQWGEGKTLTDPLPNFGMAVIEPAYGPRFTKPIMILTNELDASCGDFFPAIMQDNRKAVTFGARTGGAGGVVKKYTYQNSLLGLNEYGLTATIALRPNGQPIESLGVTPDIPYAVRPGDLQAGFADYIKAVNAAVTGLVK